MWLLLLSGTQVISDLRIPLPELVELMQGVTLWETERVFEESLVSLATRAEFSFVAAVENAPAGVMPVECLREVTRRLVSDSMRVVRADLMRVLRLILAPAVRAEAAAQPAVREVLETSATMAVPLRALSSAGSGASSTDGMSGGVGGAAGLDDLDLDAPDVPAATPGTAAAPPSATAATASTASASASAGDASAPSKAGGSTRRAEKVAAERVTGAGVGVSDGFLDNDWCLDELVEEALDRFVEANAGARIDDMIGRLRKLPGKLAL